MSTRPRYVNPSKTTLLFWQQALAIIEETDAKGVPRPFSVVFCTADVERKTGGEIIRYDKAILNVPGGRVKSKVEDPSAPSKRSKSIGRWTRNIRGVGSEQIRKLHIHLILEINGQPVK